MDEPLFDAIFALCVAAEQSGYEAVADGLELVLDVYLQERRVMMGTDIMFVSRRAAQDRDVEAFSADLLLEQSTLRWSARYFPLAAVT